MQLPTIERLLHQGVTVVCCGGGGIPVVRELDGGIGGIEAVIDKDRVSALLAVQLGAQQLFLTTGTDAIYRDFSTKNKTRIDQLTVSELVAMEDEGQFPPGSMGPKVEAAREFIEQGGALAIVCQPTDLVDAFAAKAGTRIMADAGQ